ncbi:2-iminoacetate synthase ThiH [Marinomonas sp. 15G1-11]|uniref:2-iminoacetate synthase ThiH n=1 Tax=Marinomonas phaeophyticola TaxID=3004091 RepID=A0ABT4JX83_9GAMM|nr:2-iminoacetate synthase ThiH [Marinomonas sp. 15G1-11]MCZ2722929.1 2-iminoacetate synthase ThiH [Marinomonas sp. 15G1-11]
MQTKAQRTDSKPLYFIEQSAVIKDQFSEGLTALDWQHTSQQVSSKTELDVRRALAKSRLQFEDFMALVSPAAEAFLPAIVAKSQQLTRQRFGHGMGVFAPLYLSNTCANECSYCGFSMSNPIKRLTLNEDNVSDEVRALKEKGFDNLLLVTGETSKVSVPYFKRMLPLITPHFSHLSMEVQPLEVNDYVELRSFGLDAVLVYQETYNKITYAKHHTRGKKADFNFRLDAADRLGQSQMHKIGLGVLLGLDDWRTDSVFLAYHLRHLQKRYWRSRFSISFPRIRPCEGGIQVKSEITDKQLIQLVCAWRLFDEDLELTLSTRESADFRDHILPIGFTSMSAESKTQPGGYSESSKEALEQFEISDDRPIDEITRLIKSHGLDVIWKDWDKAYNQEF